MMKKSAIILAAGKGTRMKSAMPKVMHKIAGMPMINHVVKTCEDAGIDKIVSVIAVGMDDVASAVNPYETVVQQSQNGTGDAAKAARPAFDETDDGYVIILYGDVPFIDAKTIESMFDTAVKTGMAVLGFRSENPHGYGRLITDTDETIIDIIEEKDASAEQKLITLCNAGAFCAPISKLFGWLDQLSNDNAQGEYYLTDIVKIAANGKTKCAYVLADESEVLGINSREQLAQAEYILQSRLRKNAMDNGVTLIDPATTFLSVDTQFGTDIVIEPNVFIDAGVTIGSNTTIHAFSHIEGATIGENASIGPFARIRPKSKIGDHASVGNFIEVNRSEFKTGAKSKHVSYIGDAVIGENTNIGAGTIIANYDGYHKNNTVIGRDAFIGSNSTLIAPINVGERAIIAAGSTITHDVSADDLAVARAKQTVSEGWAIGYRNRKKGENTGG